MPWLNLTVWSHAGCRTQDEVVRQITTSTKQTHLATKRAEIFRMLRDLHLLDDFAQGSAIARSVLASDAHLLRTLRLHSSAQSK
jgi:hypothetical protein